jgi:hypothetical protein
MMLLFYNISAALSIVKIATINYEIGNAYFAENSIPTADPATPKELRGMAFMSRAPFAWRSPASTWSTVGELASLVPADLWNPEAKTNFLSVPPSFPAFVVDIVLRSILS